MRGANGRAPERGCAGTRGRLERQGRLKVLVVRARVLVLVLVVLLLEVGEQEVGRAQGLWAARRRRGRPRAGRGQGFLPVVGAPGRSDRAAAATGAATGTTT